MKTFENERIHFNVPLQFLRDALYITGVKYSMWALYKPSIQAPVLLTTIYVLLICKKYVPYIMKEINNTYSHNM